MGEGGRGSFGEPNLSPVRRVVRRVAEYPAAQLVAETPGNLIGVYRVVDGLVHSATPSPARGLRGVPLCVPLDSATPSESPKRCGSPFPRGRHRERGFWP